MDTKVNGTVTETPGLDLVLSEESEVDYTLPERKVLSPREWLSRDDSHAVADFTLSDGSILQLAALTEQEVDKLQKAARRPIHPGDPKSERRINLEAFKYLMIAHSLNKASGGAGGVILPDEIQKSDKLAGEVTSIFNEIASISGYKRQDAPNQLFA